MKNWWLIYKGTNTQRKAPELDIGCVTVLWGLWVMRQWWDVCVCVCVCVCVWGGVNVFVPHQTASASASSLGVNLQLNERVWAVVDNAIAPLPSYSFRSTDARRQSRVDDEIDLKLGAEHRKTEKIKRYFINVEMLLRPYLSSPVFHSQRPT